MSESTDLEIAPVARRRWRYMRRRFNRWVTRADLYPRLEFLAAALTIILGWSSYALLTGDRKSVV